MAEFVDMRAADIAIGDLVRLDGGFHRVLDVGAGPMPYHTLLSTALATHQFPDDATLQVQFCHVERIDDPR
jgi:hypothetical protein